MDIHANAKRKQVFITVGSTKFPRLLTQIEQIWWEPELLNTEITIQYGETDISSYISNKPSNVTFISWIDNIKWELYDLVVGHCGVGTILDLNRAYETSGKGPCILFVCNDDVQDMHQSELLMTLIAMDKEQVKIGFRDSLCHLYHRSKTSLKNLSMQNDSRTFLKTITSTLNNSCETYCNHLSVGQRMLYQRIRKLGNLIGNKYGNK